MDRQSEPVALGGRLAGHQLMLRQDRQTDRQTGAAVELSIAPAMRDRAKSRRSFLPSTGLGGSDAGSGESGPRSPPRYSWAGPASESRVMQRTAPAGAVSNEQTEKRDAGCKEQAPKKRHHPELGIWGKVWGEPVGEEAFGDRQRLMSQMRTPKSDGGFIGVAP